MVKESRQEGRTNGENEFVGDGCLSLGSVCLLSYPITFPMGDKDFNQSLIEDSHIAVKHV